MQTYPYIYHPPTGNLCNRNTPVCHRLLYKRDRRKRRCTHLENSLWSCTLAVVPSIDDFCITICSLCSPYRILGHIRNRLPNIRGLVSMILEKIPIADFCKFWKSINNKKKIDSRKMSNDCYLILQRKNIIYCTKDIKVRSQEKMRKIL